MEITADRVAQRVWDLGIIGGGPGGAQAAIYGASEGLSTLVLDPDGIGGQIKGTPLLENFAGIQGGSSGPAWAAGLVHQMEKFGVRTLQARVEGLTGPGEAGPSQVRLSCGARVQARAWVISTGATWRDLDLSGAPALIESGALVQGPGPCFRTDVEGAHAIVVGGGNSAGQLICDLARRAALVTVVVRSGLRTSQYLTDRIEALANVRVVEEAHPTEVRPRTRGGAYLTLSDGQTLSGDTVVLCGGTVPNTGWLEGSDVALGPDGGVLVMGAPPRDLETTVPGVFAVGDVREGATRRLGAAIGDGSRVVSQVHNYLSTPACEECSC